MVSILEWSVESFAEAKFDLIGHTDSLTSRVWRCEVTENTDRIAKRFEV